MEYQCQKQILKDNFKQARKTYHEEMIRSKEDPVKQRMEVILNFLLEYYVFKRDIIRLKAKKYECLTDIEKERRNERKKHKVRKLKRQLNLHFRACKQVCGADRYYQIKEAFVLKRRRLQKQRKEALHLEAQQSKDNENEGSTYLPQVAELENTSREHNIMKHHPAVLGSKL